MNKTFGIVGAISFVIAVALGYLVDFPYDTLVEIALSAFGLTMLVLGAIKSRKEEGKGLGWKLYLSIGLSVVAGVLCAIAGATQSIFATIATAVVTIMTIIFGLLAFKK